MTRPTRPRRNSGTDFIAVIPTNLFGLNDNYHPVNSHVLLMKYEY